jgi:transposase
MNEQEKYETIKELVDHGGNKNKVALKLNISRRQVDRLIIIYKEKGKSSFIHGNRGKYPTKTLDKSISEDIVLLYTTKYQEFNFRHFHEYLIEDEKLDISYKYVYNHLTKAGILSPKARKRTKKEFKKQQLQKEKKINLAMSDEQIETIINHEISLEDSHPRGEKPKYFGEIIEMDGSIHLWFGDKKSLSSFSNR